MSEPSSDHGPPDDATITAIRPLPSDPNRRSVKVGRRVVARLLASEVETLRLEVGRPWTDDLAAAAEEMTASRRAREAGLRMLGRSGMTRRELCQRLAGRGFADGVVERAAEVLEADGWLDDRAFAVTLVESVLRRGPAGAAFVAGRLEARGVEAALAQRVAAEALRDRDPLEDAVDLARRRLRTRPGAPAATARRRIAAALHRRGFDEETIGAALDRIGLSRDDLDDAPGEA